MTFVYPLLLGGLLLAGLPVLLHFLMRQKAKTLPFPAFRFLLQKRRSNSRNMRLRHLLLLLLRVLLLILICLALARPRLFNTQLGLSRERPVAMVVVFDTSPSMDYQSGDITRLELAKKRCLELLDQLPEDGRVLILDTSDPASFTREDWLKSMEKARQRVQSLTIRSDNTPVTKALAEAWRRFDELDRGLGDDAVALDMARLICVFSDRTRTSWDSNANAKRPVTVDAVPVQMLYFDVGVDDPVDLAILQADLPANRQSFTDGETIRLSVVVKATGQKASNAMRVEMDGRKPVSQAFDAEAGKPQTLTLEIDTTGLAIGPHQAVIKLDTTTDNLSFNNTRFVTFAIQQKQKILVLDDGQKKADVFANYLKALLYEVNLAQSDKKQDLAGYDAVFLVGVRAPSEQLWNSLAEYVEQGKGVGIIPGTEMDLKAYHSEAGQKVMPAKILGEIPSPKGSKWHIDADQWGHPFLSLYAKWFADGAIFIDNPRQAKRYWEVLPNNPRDVVVQYDEPRHPAVVERHTKGKVLLLTTPVDEPKWNDYDEKLAHFYLVPPMMCAKHLCPEPANMRFNYQFGSQPPLASKDVGPAFKNYVLSSGDFSEEIKFDGNGRWIGERLPRQGNYTISGVNAVKTEAIHQFSINIASEESDLTRVPIEEIEAVLGKDALVPQGRNKSLIDTLDWNEPMELFPWLMILLLFVLALENLLANRFYRSEPAEPS